MEMERRLSAIFAADMVGYSRLMEADEVGTLQRQKAHRAEFIDPALEEFHGRIVKEMGDGILVEFPSVVEAVQCAVIIQRGMVDREANIADDLRIQYRIGINLGDIIIEDNDIFGDGVNVAARLEALADPGGICISRSARDQVRDKLDLNLDDQGEVEVKNIARPIRVFRVLIDEKAVALAKPVVAVATQSKINRKPFYAAALVASFVLVAGLGWWQPWSPNVVTASVANMAFPLPDKPSIAVLPFTNMSSDPEQEYFADGMTEDLITDLSKVSDLFVIARNTSFTYKGRSVSIPKVAENLGVRYVLEGSVRRSDDQVRVNAQLIDATTGGHLWAERYDGDITDYFAVQDTFVRKIVSALALNLSKSEQDEIARGQTSNLKAREAFQKGWELYQHYTAKDNAEAAKHLKLATKIDPEYGRAYSALSMVYVRGCQWRWNKELGESPNSAFSIAGSFLKKGEINSSSMTKIAASQLYLYDNEHSKAFTEAAGAVALNPNDPEAHIAMGLAMITTGKPEAGLEFVKTALRLSPSHPNHYVLAHAMAYFSMNDLEQAATILVEALDGDPGAVDLAPLLAASYAHLGRRKDARVALLRYQPDASQSELQDIAGSYHYPYKWAYSEGAMKDRLIDGLHIAALPLDVSISNLADALKSKDEDDRIRGARTLALFGPKAVVAVPALIDALADKKLKVRKEVIATLGAIGPAAKPAIPALEALKDEKFMQFVVSRAIKKIANE
jgi:adenylate cyclase